MSNLLLLLAGAIFARRLEFPFLAGSDFLLPEQFFNFEIIFLTYPNNLFEMLSVL